MAIGMPQVMHQAMQEFVPDEKHKSTALARAVKAGRQFLLEQNLTVDAEVMEKLCEAALEVWTLYCRLASSKLLPKELWEQLPPLYSQEHEEDPLVICKFFTPDSSWTWYAYEFDGLDTFFGWVVGLDAELGYFLLSELEEARGPLGLPIERDLHFTPTRLSEVKQLDAAMPGTVYIVSLDDEQTQDKEYSITTICRDDLVELGATQEQLLVLTDGDMMRVARRVGEVYVEYGSFWADLRAAVNAVFKEKGGAEIVEVEDEGNDA